MRVREWGRGALLGFKDESSSALKRRLFSELDLLNTLLPHCSKRLKCSADNEFVSMDNLLAMYLFGKFLF